MLRAPTEKRSLDHNARFHAMCRDIAKHVEWAGRKWSDEEWKRIFLGAKFGQAVVPCPLGGGPVVVNKRRSSRLTNEHMEELLGEMEAFGAEHGVEWTSDE
jgi:sugar phosphate isomerase/epimerase